MRMELGLSPLLKASLAEAEARNGELKAALATLEEALDGFDRTGQRWFNAEIHRMRGGILLELNPEDPALAVDALLTAIGVAQAQKTSQLRAAGGARPRPALSINWAPRRRAGRNRACARRLCADARASRDRGGVGSCRRHLGGSAIVRGAPHDLEWHQLPPAAIRNVWLTSTPAVWSANKCLR